MAISITSLSPTKNEVDVPVGDNIEVTLSSDAADLDVNTTMLFINGVEVQPSAYYGVDNTEVNVNFFSKKKIKYKTGRRYGQPGLTYGQTDIFPSAFHYGQRYVCTIQIEDVDGNEFEESFSFTIEEGIFFNDTPPLSFYLMETQGVANYTPDWAKARYDKFSNFQQFVNAPAKFLQQISDSLFRQTSNYFVQTANPNDLHTLYKVELGGDFEFQTTVLDDGTRLQIPPDVSSILEITRFFPNAEFRNDIKSFYQDKLPTRLDEDKFAITDLVISTKQLVDDLEISIDKELERIGYICLVIEDGVKFTEIKGGVTKFLTCRIKGKSRERKDQTEDIIIIDNDNYFSTKAWREIESIQFINLPEDSGINITVDHARPLGTFVPDSFINISTGDDTKASFWKLNSSAYGSVLEQHVLLKVDAEDIVSSQAEKDLIVEYELLDIDNTTNLNLIDVEVDAFSDFMYGIDNTHLYIFDKREEYPSVVKQLPGENGIADFVLDIDSDELGRGDTVKEFDISLNQRVFGKTVAQYRLSVLRPDDVVEYILLDGTTTTVKEDGAIVTDPSETQLITSPVTYQMDILGDYVVKVDTVYRDGTQDLDAYIIRLHKKSALVKYKLERLFDTATVERIFVDFDHQVKILDDNDELHTIKFARDNMLIDYTNSILYFNEDYDEVEVEDG